MQPVSLDEAKDTLATLVEAAMRGEEVLIAQDEQHAVQLVPRALPPKKRGPRPIGLMKGQIWIADDFKAGLPEFRPYMESALMTKIRIKAEIARLNVEDLDDFLRMTKEFADARQRPKPSLMSKLKSIKIDAPADFSAKLDLYPTEEIE